jgi:hypothetical protein
MNALNNERRVRVSVSRRQLHKPRTTRVVDVTDIFRIMPLLRRKPDASVFSATGAAFKVERPACPARITK